MSKEKRRCIFTNDIADTRLIIPPEGAEAHNWARQVPCSKKYLQSKTSPDITEEEFKQIDLFFQLELSKAKVAHYLNAINVNMEKFKNRVFASDFSKLIPETLTVSDEAFDQIIEEIANPKKPNAKFQKAMEKHKKLTDQIFVEESKKLIKNAINKIEQNFDKTEPTQEDVPSKGLESTIAERKEEEEDLWT